MKFKNILVSQKLFFCLFLGFVLLSSCKKQEIKGPQGDPGPNGTGGNSSISASSVFTIDSTAWHLSADSKYWEVSTTQTLITQNIVDKGAVKVYMQVNGYWWELPYAIADYVTQFSFKEGVLRLMVIDVEGGVPPKPEKANYRLVVLSQAS